MTTRLLTLHRPQAGRLLACALSLLLAACNGNSSPTDTPAVVWPEPTATEPLPAASVPLRETPSAGRSLLGANPPPINDYSRTHVYVDLVKQARRFGGVAEPWDEKALIGSDGWPVGDFGAFLMTRQAGVTGIGGAYTVLFEGRATVSPVASDASVRSNQHNAARNTSTVVVDLAPGADQLVLAFTQTGSGIKNLRVIRPGYDPDRPPLFTHAFLDHVRRFQTLRFMDWLRTNNNPVTTWAARTDPNRVRHASRNGVPWEHIIALAQQTGQDIWINIPVAADDDYVTQLARRLQAELPASTRIYVEYSNEVWNGQFKQHGTNWALAKADVEQNPASLLRHDGSDDPDKWGYRRIAQRGKEISDIFRQVYGDAAMMNTIRPVFATQVVNPYASQLGLAFVAAVHGPPARYFYAMAGAPYFNLGPSQRQEGLSTDQVLSAMQRSVTDLPRINQFERNLALATWYGLPFMAYEGGSDTFGEGSLKAKMDANLDPRMEGICNSYLENWYAAGGDLFMWFNAGAGDWMSPYGAWELTTDLALTDTPKIRCVDGVLGRDKPATAARNTAPGRFSALAYAGSTQPPSEESKVAVRHLGLGAALDYLVFAQQAGNYRLTLHAAAGGGNSVLGVSVNATPMGTARLTQTGWGQPTAHPELGVRLRAGLNTLRITTVRTHLGFDLRELELAHDETSPSPAMGAGAPGARIK